MFLLKPFNNQFPYPKELDYFTLLPQVQRHNVEEDICHPLLIGGSGCGKSTYIKSLNKIFPKSSDIEMKQLSEAKFYGGIKNDKVTDVGVVMKQRGGTLTIDEADKDQESFFKGSNMLNEVLGSQTATKEKIGVSIRIENTDLRINTIMNPDPEKKLDTMQWVCKKFHESTVNRFFVIDFDNFMTSKMESAIDRNYYTGGLNKINDFDLEVRKRLILYLREIKVDLNDILEDLIMFQENFKKLPLVYAESTTRNLRNIKNIVIAVCRLKGKAIADKSDLKEGINLLMWALKTKGENLEEFLFGNQKAEQIKVN